MEERKEELIKKLMEQDGELRRHIEEHEEFERQLEEFNKKPYLTTEEEMKRKTIQKLKLAGKDKIETILAKYRNIK